MKIAICSDIHLEFAPLTIHNREKADLLILAGDILCPHKRAYDHVYREFFENVASEYPNIIMIMGNHEHYFGKYEKTAQLCREYTENHQNIAFFDSNSKEIDGILFTGGTLWTDMNRENPVSMNRIQGGMNDHVIINYGEGRFLPIHAIELHKKYRQHIEESIANHDKVVVITHHAPLLDSIAEEYKRDTTHLNYAYANDLYGFVTANPQIKLWVHGHTHFPFDYECGSTRVVCNPRGYHPYEKSSKNYTPKVVEI